MNPSISILIPDGESHLTTGVLMGLSDIKGLRIHVLSSQRAIAARFSRFVTKAHFYPIGLNTADWIDRINSLIINYKIDVVLPIYDTTIRKLIAHRERLISPDCFLLPSDLNTFDRAKNKERLAELIKEIDLPATEFWKVIPNASSDHIPDEEVFPILLKPTQNSGSGRGIMRFSNRAALMDFLSQNPLGTPYFMQEEIQGYDMGCHVLCKNGEVLAYTMQKGFLFSPRPFTPQVGMHMIFEESVYRQVEKLMKHLSWNGVADFDLRYDKKSGTFKILEINPRFWLTQHASQVAGVNFPWLYCLTVLGKNFEKPEYSKCDYHTWNGLRLEMKKGSRIFLNLGYIWNNTPVKYLFRDPGMILFDFMLAMKNFLKSKLFQLRG